MTWLGNSLFHFVLTREKQEHESDSFKSIFKEGIIYLKGNGTDSGKRLLLVKGRTHHVSAQEVDLGSNALNRCDCCAVWETPDFSKHSSHVFDFPPEICIQHPSNVSIHVGKGKREQVYWLCLANRDATQNAWARCIQRPRRWMTFKRSTNIQQHSRKRKSGWTSMWWCPWMHVMQQRRRVCARCRWRGLRVARCGNRLLWAQAGAWDGFKNQGPRKRRACKGRCRFGAFTLRCNM